MQIVCSWCEKFLGYKEPLSDRSITNSICGECYREANDKIEELRKESREGVVDLTDGKILKAK